MNIKNVDEDETLGEKSKKSIFEHLDCPLLTIGTFHYFSKDYIMIE